MRDEIKLIRAALGVPDFEQIKRQPVHDVGCFHLFTVELPSLFRGLPPRWDFAVLAGVPQGKQAHDERHVLRDAETLIDRMRWNSDVGLMLLSDDPAIHLTDDLAPQDRKVFCLDAPEFERGVSASNPQLTPFFRAIRRKLTRHELDVLAFSPYLRTLPVTDWRFFGRARELTELINRKENFLVIGGRRIGKTSLMKELKRRLEQKGQDVYLVDVNDCIHETQVVERIVESISPRDSAAAMRRKNLLGGRLLNSVLKRLASGANAVLILDEFGNVVERNQRTQWEMIGILRHYAQDGRLRVIITGFQELLLRQQSQFEGPLVNLATTIRLKTFSLEEIADFVVGPLELWGSIRNRRNLCELVEKGVGKHPYLLQYFCCALFEKVSQQSDQDVQDVAASILENDRELLPCFATPVNDLFHTLGSPTLQYLFLLRCREADQASQVVAGAELNDDWTEAALLKAGFHSTTDVRRKLLEGLEVRGLTEPVLENPSVQAIVAPVVYRFLKRSESNLDRLLGKYLSEIKLEASSWIGLRAVEV
jgi:AAA domain